MPTKKITKAKSSRNAAAYKKDNAQSNGEVTAHAGIIPMVVRGGDKDGQKFDMDCTLVITVANRLVQKHKLASVDGTYVTTVEFIKELDAAIKELGYPSTPTIATGLWQRASEFFHEVQKKTSQ